MRGQGINISSIGRINFTISISNHMMRIASAIFLLALSTFYLGLSNVYAFPYGSVTIASYPSTVSMSSFNIVTIAQWSDVVGTDVKVVIQLIVINTWSNPQATNKAAFSAACTSGCEGNTPSGKLTSTFSISPQTIPYPVNGTTINPTQLNAYAQIYVCVGRTSNTYYDCTTLTSSTVETIAVSG